MTVDPKQPSPPSAEEPADPKRLVEFFTTACRPDPSTHLIGTELEKFGLSREGDQGPMLPVSFIDHIAPAMRGLVEKHGWDAGPDRGESGEVVELRRSGASITLEPGGQFELSGAPLPNVHQTCAEFTQHYEELDSVSKPLGLIWMAAGHHPFATRDDVNWMPKGRYKIMRAYLPTKGSMALDMMLRTCTVQANFDYATEQQAGRRLRLASAMAPVVTAMFANSPYLEGEAAGFQSRRSFVWTDVDSDRCGLQPFFFEPNFSFDKYVDWAKRVPMFFVKRDGRYHPHHVSFETFIRDGFTDPDGRRHEATWSDWVTHLSTLFPEVRLKPHLEFRSADAVGSRYVCALPALLKGLLYDEDAADEAWSLFSDMDFEARMARWHEAVRYGMHAKPVHEHAKRLLQIGRAALDKMNVRDSKDRTEARFLDPLEPLVEQGRSPADLALEALGDRPGRGPQGRAAFAEHFRFAG